MKKLNKKLALQVHTVRVLASPELDQVAGGRHATPTTTVLRHSANAAVPCRLTGGVHTAPCRYTA